VREGRGRGVRGREGEKRKTDGRKDVGGREARRRRPEVDTGVGDFLIFFSLLWREPASPKKNINKTLRNIL
jgi:hypothetical protein